MCIVCVCVCVVIDRMKPVALESFRDHVAEKHDDRDKGFETEYQVNTLCSHTSAWLPAILPPPYMCCMYVCVYVCV